MVPAFLWCALLVADCPPVSRQAPLMLFVVLVLVVMLASSPPDKDSKFDCMNLSRLPTWSTLSMLKIKKYTKKGLDQICHDQSKTRGQILKLVPDDSISKLYCC